jgi:hypothetical protein
MAPACTGVGVTKPAAVRRALRESEIWKSVKVMADAASVVAVMVRETCRGSGFRIESRVRVDKNFPLQWVKERMNAVTRPSDKRTNAAYESTWILIQHCLVWLPRSPSGAV